MIKGRVYKIINLDNGKVYIGQTINSLECRWKIHLGDMKLNYFNIYFYNAIRKYGTNNFKIEELLKCYSQEDLDFFEDYYIVVWDTMNPEKGYNCKRGGLGGRLGDDVKKRMSESHKGMKHSEETKKKMSKTRKKFYENEENRRKQMKRMNSIETKRKIKKTLKEYWSNLENRKKQSEKIKESLNIPEIKKKHKKAIEIYWSNLENRKKQLEIKKEYFKKKNQEYEKAKQENDFENMKYDDLYDIAKRLNIFSRGLMNKQILIEKLEEVC